MTINADIDDDVDLSGYYVSDLQTDIAIDENGKVTGELSFISDYSSAFGLGQDSGNYIALHCATEEEDTEIACYTIGGDYFKYTPDENGIVIIRVRAENLQIKVVASKEGYAITNRILDLSKVEREPGTLPPGLIDPGTGAIDQDSPGFLPGGGASEAP